MQKEIFSFLMLLCASCSSAQQVDIVNGHECVDLGLSVKWATCNVGARNRDDYGDFFAWGETSPKRSYTEYNSKTNGKPMGDIAGDSIYDAARANWGGSWRLPTMTEWDELYDSCQWDLLWTRQYGSVYLITGPNGNSIYLPMAGILSEKWLYFAGEYGGYWSSTPDENDAGKAYYLGLRDRESIGDVAVRYLGYTVRPVTDGVVSTQIDDLSTKVSVSVPANYKDGIDRLYKSADFCTSAVIPQAKAWCKVANAIYPSITGDTDETAWIKSQVDSLAFAISSSMPVEEQLLILDRIQAQVAYLLGYNVENLHRISFGAVLYELYRLPMLSESMYNSILAGKESFIYAELELELQALQGFSDIMLLGRNIDRGFIERVDYTDVSVDFVTSVPVFGEAINLCEAIDRGTDEEIDEYIDIFEGYIKSLYEQFGADVRTHIWGQRCLSTLFFINSVYYAVSFGGSDFWNKHKSEYMEIAHWMDSQKEPFSYCIHYENMELPSLTDKEFYDAQLQSYKHRARLVELLAEAITEAVSE